jgi:hypothetical protein
MYMITAYPLKLFVKTALTESLLKSKMQSHQQLKQEIESLTQ